MATRRVSKNMQKKDLAEKARDVEVTILVKTVKRHGTTSIQGRSFKSFLGQATGWGRNQ